MKCILKGPTLFLLLFFLKMPVWGITEGVYGTDNRRFVCDAVADSVYSAADYMQLARSVCLIIHKTRVTEVWQTGTGDTVPYPKGGFDVEVSGTLERYLKIDHTANSADVRFKDALTVISKYTGIGTGVMVGDRQILTADHIFENVDPSQFYAIFNWTETPSGTSTKINFEPYYCFRIIGYDTYSGTTLKQVKPSGSNDKMDLSIIKTDRIMDWSNGNIPPLNIYSSSTVKKDLVGKQLFMIGHCMGLPQVLTADAFVNSNITYEKAKLMVRNLTDTTQDLTQNQFNRLCFANLDGFGGNSGSPVFVKDKNFGASIVGIFTGGARDYYRDTSSGSVIAKEDFYTKADFDQSKVFEHFQTLQGFPPFKKHCDDDCDYMVITEKSIKNPLRTGQWITLTMPIGFDNGVYAVIFASGVAKKVVYYNGQPMPSIIKGFVGKGVSYDVNMVNLKSQQFAYSFHRTGIAQGKEIKTGNVFHVKAEDDGLLTDRVNFVPNKRFGEMPLVVNFNAYVPNPETIVSCTWDFGDGSTSTLLYPSHVYTTPGKRTVKLTVQYPGYTSEFLYNDCVEVLDSKDLILLSGDVKKFAIFGVSDVKINDRARCVDNNYFYMPIGCSNGNITLGSQAKSGSLFCRGGVWLRDYAMVDGDIKAGTTVTYQNNVSVTGKTETRVTIPVVDLPITLNPLTPITYASSEMTGDVFIEPGNTCELTPGKYYSYTIKSNSKLKLISGVYYFNKLELDAGSSLQLDEQDGPVRIYVSSNISLKGTIVHSLPGAAGPRNFLVGYCGTNWIFLDYGFSGTFVAPNAPLVIGQAVKSFEGCFYAKTVEVHQEAIVKYLPYGY